MVLSPRQIAIVEVPFDGYGRRGHLRRGGPWWLHVDVDVLDPAVMPAASVPGDDPEHDHGGLAWPQLTAMLTASVRRGGCVGMSAAVYDPCLDPRREYASRIVELIHRLLDALGDRPR